ncbi:unnamed protein product, partial [Ectocarpus fasciculatus]
MTPPSTVPLSTVITLNPSCHRSIRLRLCDTFLQIIFRLTIFRATYCQGRWQSMRCGWKARSLRRGHLRAFCSLGTTLNLTIFHSRQIRPSYELACLRTIRFILHFDISRAVYSRTRRNGRGGGWPVCSLRRCGLRNHGRLYSALDLTVLDCRHLHVCYRFVRHCAASSVSNNTVTLTLGMIP